MNENTMYSRTSKTMTRQFNVMYSRHHTTSRQKRFTLGHKTKQSVLTYIHKRYTNTDSHRHNTLAKGREQKTDTNEYKVRLNNRQEEERQHELNDK